MKNNTPKKGFHSFRIIWKWRQPKVIFRAFCRDEKLDPPQYQFFWVTAALTDNPPVHNPSESRTKVFEVGMQYV